MSYEPHEWVAGETVTASKLNHLEQGINEVSGILVATIEYPSESEADAPKTRDVVDASNITSPTIISHTWQELYDAVEDGKVVFFRSKIESVQISEPTSGEIKGTKSTGDIIYNYYRFDLLSEICFNGSAYIVVDGSTPFDCSSPDDYPSLGSLDLGDDSGGTVK